MITKRCANRKAYGISWRRLLYLASYYFFACNHELSSRVSNFHRRLHYRHNCIAIMIIISTGTFEMLHDDTVAKVIFTLPFYVLFRDSWSLPIIPNYLRLADLRWSAINSSLSLSNLNFWELLKLYNLFRYTTISISSINFACSMANRSPCKYVNLLPYNDYDLGRKHCLSEDINHNIEVLYI